MPLDCIDPRSYYRHFLLDNPAILFLANCISGVTNQVNTRTSIYLYRKFILYFKICFQTNRNEVQRKDMRKYTLKNNTIVNITCAKRTYTFFQSESTKQHKNLVKHIMKQINPTSLKCLQVCERET